MVGSALVFVAATTRYEKSGSSPVVVPVHGNKTLKTGMQREIMKHAVQRVTTSSGVPRRFYCSITIRRAMRRSPLLSSTKYVPGFARPPAVSAPAVAGTNGHT